ncbi:hypothetical protein BJ508DRAFT_339354 [Ascobolus immersus RN42]|uniref:Uncharacterized protein n=1 Tax=Ascobolus immersus RN42 TaxID=1160509 RepID=A0A3N4IEZ4_ASCIM|nr:hypothetical protein BJ508DRAFT_339354 [Ascobolus immersus RN42]
MSKRRQSRSPSPADSTQPSQKVVKLELPATPVALPPRTPPSSPPPRTNLRNRDISKPFSLTEKTLQMVWSGCHYELREMKGCLGGAVDRANEHSEKTGAAWREFKRLQAEEREAREAVNDIERRMMELKDEIKAVECQIDAVQQKK